MKILLSIVSGFASGVFVRSLFFESWWPIIFMLVPMALFSAFAFLKPRMVYAAGALFCVFAMLGMLRATFSETPLPQTFAQDLGQRVSYEGVVIADPDVRDKNQRVKVRISQALPAGRQGSASTIMLAVAPRYPSVMVGDHVRVSGTLSLPEAFADDNGRVFRYDKYLQRDGVRFMLDFAYLQVESHASRYSLPAALARVKHAFLDGIASALPEPHSSLAGGIVLGGKSGLGKELKDAFTRSGLVHIVVLSGHNVMIVASWVIAFFIFIFARAETVFKMHIPRGASIAAGALALITFVGIAGFSATAIRAALMALIALYARATGRTYAAGRALLIVVLLMLVWNPLYLAFDPGFSLSVAATAGLIWLAPFIETLLTRIKSEFVRSATATTLAAQIAVLPLLLYFTGNLSIVAIPANVIAALIVPFAMAFSYLAGFGGIVFGPLAPLLAIVIGIPAYLASSALISLAEASASLPLAAFTLPPFPFWLMLLAYGALIYFASSQRFSTTLQLRFTKKASM